MDINNYWSDSGPTVPVDLGRERYSWKIGSASSNGRNMPYVPRVILRDMTKCSYCGGKRRVSEGQCWSCGASL